MTLWIAGRPPAVVAGVTEAPLAGFSVGGWTTGTGSAVTTSTTAGAGSGVDGVAVVPHAMASAKIATASVALNKLVLLPRLW